jgi:hypothetical protein
MPRDPPKPLLLLVLPLLMQVITSLSDPEPGTIGGGCLPEAVMPRSLLTGVCLLVAYRHGLMVAVTWVANQVAVSQGGLCAWLGRRRARPVGAVG